MFKGIQDIMQKQASAKPVEIDSSLLRVQSARVILDTEKRQDMMGKLPALLCLSGDNFEKLVVKFIENLAEFVQDLPETRSGYYSFRGGILDHAMNRATISLSLLRAYFLPDGDEHSHLTQPQTLWAYAIFTAAALMGIGKIAVDLIVELYDAEGKYLKPWSAFDGRMITMATYYKYDFDTPFPETFRNRVTALLARQLLPVEGFRWLASNKDLFQVWLDLLDDDERGGHTLGPILWLADSLSIQQYFELISQGRDPKSFLDRGKSSPLGGTFSQIQDTRLGGTQAGIAFLNWLREGIEASKIKIGGESPVHYVPEGVVLNPGIFEVFVKENPQFKNWQAVQTAFGNLGIHRTFGGANEIFQQYIRTNNLDPIQGILINNAALILPKKMLDKQTSAQNYARVTKHNMDTAKFISTTGKLVSTPPTQTLSNDPNKPSTAPKG